MITPAQLAIPSGIEVVVVLLIAVLLFGANKIPKLANAAGRSLGEFKRGREELEDELANDGGDDGSEDDGAETAD
ncbi:twin-arginine translocase TatA/TatE family subunit [Halostella litorea]|uniref:twin-arginine translocase TatA/TatE family subunit n=1 Tax=Halostella litorea TaxID=2528831 RepID=UPI00109333E5